jgi:hypothetical protein
MDTTTNHTHALAVKRCARVLGTLGIRLTRADYYRDGYDLVADGSVRIAVRHATARVRKGKVYRRIDGTVSEHPYLRWTFNFHRHGKLDPSDRYCDFFVCLLEGTTGSRLASPKTSAFVIPWERVSALTFSSSLREGSTRTYRGRYAPYRGAWHLIRSASGGAPASVSARGRSTVVVQRHASFQESSVVASR